MHSNFATASDFLNSDTLICSIKDSYQELDPEALRVQFGKIFKIWFTRNNWPQDVPHKLHEVIPTGGPWNSQVSVCMSGRLEPKVGFFIACGKFNKLIAEQKFPGVSSSKLAERLQGAEPLRLDSGEPFVAHDFFNLYSGLMEVPLAYQVPDVPALTDGDAKTHSSDMRAAFQKIAAYRMLSPMAAWESLLPLLSAMNAGQKSRFKEVLSGWGDYTAEELEAMPSSRTENAFAPGVALYDWDDRRPA